MVKMGTEYKEVNKGRVKQPLLNPFQWAELEKIFSKKPAEERNKERQFG